jgi:3-phosphoshikimate 1-carboxyvinyltransferase
MSKWGDLLFLSSSFRFRISYMIIKPAKRLNGRLNLPGDKSISHRAAMLGALATGETRIENFATSADCASTLNCVEQLGASVERVGPHITIRGAGLGGLRESSNKLDCGNSGSTMRMLAGILAGQNFTSRMIGDESLSKRPMKRVIGPLEEMGATILSTEGHAPLTVVGKHPLRPISYALPVASAQVKSCILLAGLNAEGRTEVIESIPTRDHTERMLRWFGIEVEETKEEDRATRLSIEGLKPFKARDVFVPSDISSAAFFLVAASCLPDSNLELSNVGLNPTRAAIIQTMIDLGANITIENQHEQSNEPIGDIHVKSKIENRKSKIKNILSGPVIAQLIDELPVLAVFGSQLEGGLTIRDAAELRIKESDRIKTVVENLRAMGANVEEYEDGLSVAGPVKLKGARVNSHGDHRIAMAFAVAGLFATGETEIIGADAVAVSFPNFFELLESVAER